MAQILTVKRDQKAYVYVSNIVIDCWMNIVNLLIWEYVRG